MYLSSSACALQAPRASSSGELPHVFGCVAFPATDFDHFVQRLPADVALKKQAKCEFASATSFAHNAHASF
jgi:hypothetical protein